MLVGIICQICIDLTKAELFFEVGIVYICTVTPLPLWIQLWCDQHYMCSHPIRIQKCLTINWKVDALPLTHSDFLSCWHSPCFEELFARTWWGWTPHFNSAPMASKEEKRTKHACLELRLRFLRVEWEHTLSRRHKTSVQVDPHKLLESRMFCPGIYNSFGWGKDKSGSMIWISLSRLSPIVTQPITIYSTWTLLTPWTAIEQSKQYSCLEALHPAFPINCTFLVLM